MHDMHCKAKAVETNKWVYGYFWSFNVGMPDFIRNTQYGLPIDTEVHPKSVCKCSGVYANKLQLIYEHDIVTGVQVNGTWCDCEVIYFEGCFWYQQLICERLVTPLHSEVGNSMIEIIGNMIDKEAI